MLKRLKKYSKVSSTSGFTLIELLIVVVIIGILAGVLITIIDPATAQNRARDAGIEATLNKVALATEAYASAYGSYPDGASFIGSLATSVSDPGVAGCGTGNNNCAFAVSGNGLDATCSANNFSGNGTSQCYYYYLRFGGGSSFYLMAKSAGDNTQVFKYTSQSGALDRCDAASVNIVTGGC